MIDKDRCPICSHPGGPPESHRHDTEGTPETVEIPAPVVLMTGREVSLASLARGGRAVTPGKVADEAVAHGWEVRASVALAGMHALRRVALGSMAEDERRGQRKTRDVVTPGVVDSVALWMRKAGRVNVWAVWRDGAFDTAGWTSAGGLAGGVGVMALLAYLAADPGMVAG